MNILPRYINSIVQVLSIDMHRMIVIYHLIIMFNKRVRNGNKPRIAIYSMCSLYIIDVSDDFFKVFLGSWKNATNIIMYT